MTPRQLHALRKRRIEQMQREELLIGILASTTANYSFCRPEKPIPASAYMLHPLPEPEPVPLTGDSLMSMVRGLPSQFVTKGSA